MQGKGGHIERLVIVLFFQKLITKFTLKWEARAKLMLK